MKEKKIFYKDIFLKHNNTITNMIIIYDASGSDSMHSKSLNDCHYEKSFSSAETLQTFDFFPAEYMS